MDVPGLDFIQLRLSLVLCSYNAINFPVSLLPLVGFLWLVFFLFARTGEVQRVFLKIAKDSG